MSRRPRFFFQRFDLGDQLTIVQKEGGSGLVTPFHQRSADEYFPCLSRIDWPVVHFFPGR